MQPHPRRSVDELLAGAKAGVSLAEILVLVALVGLLAGAMLPAYLQGRPSARGKVRSAAAELTGVLETARYRAVALERPVYVEFEPEGTEDFYTAYVDLDGDRSTGPAGSPGEVARTAISFPDEASGIRGRRLPDGVVFGLGAAGSPADGYARGPRAAIELPTNPIVFQPPGDVSWPTGLLAPAGGVYLRDASDPTVVNVVLVHPTGLIRNYRWSEGRWR